MGTSQKIKCSSQGTGFQLSEGWGVVAFPRVCVIGLDGFESRVYFSCYLVVRRGFTEGSFA